MSSLYNAYLPKSLGLSNQQSFTNETFMGLPDSHLPVNEGSHQEGTQYRIYFDWLLSHLKSGRCVGLSNPGGFHEFEGDKKCPSSILLQNGEQQIELIL